MVFRLTTDKKLNCKHEYSFVFAGRKSLYGKYFQVIYRKHSVGTPCQHNNARLGLAIAKKHHKLAVMRNKLKRIAREVFRTSDLKNVDIIVLSKSHKSRKHTQILNAHLFQDLQQLFNKIGAL